MTNPDLQKTIKALENYLDPSCHIFDISNVRNALTLLKAQQWISVEDETPEWGVVVLVPGGQAHFEGDAWYAYTRYGCREIEWEVTHWMPLPAPPQESANGS